MDSEEGQFLDMHKIPNYITFDQLHYLKRDHIYQLCRLSYENWVRLNNQHPDNILNFVDQMTDAKDAEYLRALMVDINVLDIEKGVTIETEFVKKIICLIVQLMPPLGSIFRI